ncbi:MULTISPECIES: hypothetical protein [Pseudomonas]|uniref:Uncharacterized protein n=1 Tax=Phytopseudomonas flavescens TaxID=29435 RepID=A0A7Y9XKN5_9GAMM|nr:MULTISPECIES: hypothetical protein [Pseudomonas]MCW2293550.1 hypothetical protein [Pseudomonas sp. BIGb0408]NYH71879.1 hypothetical protein [Pseudomonas flavescens]
MSRIISSVGPTPEAEATDVSDSLMFGTPKERLDFYRREIQYETNLLADRTNAYLAAQSFLVIAYASSMANANPSWGDLFTLVVPALLALLGIISSLNAWPGIKASSAIIGHWHFKQEQLLRSEPKFGHAYDESPLFSEHESSDERYYKSLRFSLRSPWLFTIFWMVLGLFSLWLQLSSTAKL